MPRGQARHALRAHVRARRTHPARGGIFPRKWWVSRTRSAGTLLNTKGNVGRKPRNQCFRTLARLMPFALCRGNSKIVALQRNIPTEELS